MNPFPSAESAAARLMSPPSQPMEIGDSFQDISSSHARASRGLANLATRTENEFARTSEALLSAAYAAAALVRAGSNPATTVISSRQLDAIRRTGIALHAWTYLAERRASIPRAWAEWDALLLPPVGSEPRTTLDRLARAHYAFTTILTTQINDLRQVWLACQQPAAAPSSSNHPD